MSEISDHSKPKKKKASHLKLVISNPPPDKTLFNTKDSNTGFAAEIQKIGHSHYALIAHDPFHHLGYRIVLELHDNQDEEGPKSVTCHFPDMVAEELNQFVGEDETLYALILIQFQMKILTQILLFCQDLNVLNLIIYANDTSEGHALGIYDILVAYEDRIPTLAGTKTQMVIPVTRKTFNKWVDHMKQANQDFRQALWEDQRCNPSIQAYLKLDPTLRFFG
ncbi:MAG: hypothetical protein K0R76_1550 [Alphaproteobacteria bacterium]|jgi:hypothetical protein|nr:hypothetical protein [Alphaproteobacteria bacterium]MDF3034596.1 hypothetical protein [Alphaproteobacteria bacterium]